MEQAEYDAQGRNTTQGTKKHGVQGPAYEAQETEKAHECFTHGLLV
ncbi:hypothetical protein [Shouchella shacheensis]|nr:hypothetical protein [Shouchella shacheensis]